jgi:hypothetical protein
MSADDSNDASVLPRLALSLVGTLVHEPASLVVGRVPDGWPSSLIPPPPASVLGGTSAGRSLTAIFFYPHSVEAPFADCCALLEANGWTPPGGILGEGFASTGSAMLCRESMLANVRRTPSTLPDTSIVVSLAPCDGWPCSADAKMPDHGTLRVPRLQSPPGVRWDSGGGSSGGGDQTTSHIRVTTDVAPAELLPFYSTQLTAAGWKTGALQISETSAIQWLDATDHRGRSWHGLLNVYMNGAGSEVFIYMATVRTQLSP